MALTLAAARARSLKEGLLYRATAPDSPSDSPSGSPPQWQRRRAVLTSDGNLYFFESSEPDATASEELHVGGRTAALSDATTSSDFSLVKIDPTQGTRTTYSLRAANTEDRVEWLSAVAALIVGLQTRPSRCASQPAMRMSPVLPGSPTPFARSPSSGTVRSSPSSPLVQAAKTAHSLKRLSLTLPPAPPAPAEMMMTVHPPGQGQVDIPPPSAPPPPQQIKKAMSARDLRKLADIPPPTGPAPPPPSGPDDIPPPPVAHEDRAVTPERSKHHRRRSTSLVDGAKPPADFIPPPSQPPPDVNVYSPRREAMRNLQQQQIKAPECVPQLPKSVVVASPELQRPPSPEGAPKRKKLSKASEPDVQSPMPSAQTPQGSRKRTVSASTAGAAPAAAPTQAEAAGAAKAPQWQQAHRSSQRTRSVSSSASSGVGAQRNPLVSSAPDSDSEVKPLPVLPATSGSPPPSRRREDSRGRSPLRKEATLGAELEDRDTARRGQQQGDEPQLPIRTLQLMSDDSPLSSPPLESPPPLRRVPNPFLAASSGSDSCPSPGVSASPGVSPALRRLRNAPTKALPQLPTSAPEYDLEYRSPVPVVPADALARPLPRGPRATVPPPSSPQSMGARRSSGAPATVFHSALGVYLVPESALYTFGGHAADGDASAAVEIYDPVQRQWYAAAPMACARDCCSACACGSRAYVTGGTRSGGAPLSSAELYDPECDCWRALPQLRTARWLHACCALGSTVVAAGGFNVQDGNLCSVESLLGADASWAEELPPLPTPREGLAVCEAFGTLWAAGGSNRDGDPLALVERYDVSLRSWRPGPPLRVARRALCLVRCGDYVYALGGEDTNEQPLADVERLRVAAPEGSAWEGCSPMCCARAGLAAAALGGSVFAFGGTGVGGIVLAGAEQYDTDAGTWRDLPEMPTPRSHFCACAL
eukprot:m51a1_g5923 putative kelch domain-containing protein (932) ;mRNA; r:64024-67094